MNQLSFFGNMMNSNFRGASQLEELLNKENLTLQEVIDEEGVVMELKSTTSSINAKLNVFFDEEK